MGKKLVYAKPRLSLLAGTESALCSDGNSASKNGAGSVICVSVGGNLANKSNICQGGSRDAHSSPLNYCISGASITSETACAGGAGFIALARDACAAGPGAA